ncbi:kinase-like protein [Aaosphaeria arxii CBS 175.79]|uniref:Kinase-like protein n=1 Tax=Aaosphaeria arxii CBS 175.79 TaxID=1450172 RepID=A0A6A5Y4R4_9PLEO|nr:kinase-like protein [Aaosphaeria arxii CBS 175.79]KAF2020246.1 kinase-like protein [Aaosphaeria arxii CBS 175.79]
MRQTVSTQRFINTKRYRPILNDVLDAFEAFCANGSNRVAWRNLRVFLTIYIAKYFDYNNGLPSRSSSVRANHLASLPVPHLGHLIGEVVYVLLLSAGVLRASDDRIPWPVTEDTRKLSLVSEAVLHRILLDVTIELSDLLGSARLDRSSGVLFGFIHDWNPSESEHLYERVYSFQLLMSEAIIEPVQIERKETLLDTSVNRLRRALSARLGSKRRSNKSNQLAEGITPRNRPISIALGETLVRPKAQLLPDNGLFEDFIVGSTTNTQLNTITEEESSNDSNRTLVPSSKSTKSIKHASRKSSIDILRIKELRKSDSLHPIIFDDAQSARSGTSGHNSFFTAETHISITSDMHQSGNRNSISTFISIATSNTFDQDLMCSAYRTLLEEHDLIPEPTMETNWSGRGQHAEYGKDEHDDIPLQVEMVLGKTRTALVESVRCKRVRLVRKTMRCTKWSGITREDALREVQHLYRVQHSHIVRLVGTYVIGNDLAILTYPCAEWNLEVFMRTLTTAEDMEIRRKSLRHFFTCLAKVLDFMHSFPLKHMDIKPQNLLVRDIRGSDVNDSDPYKIYFTDFGISRSYPSIEESETETPTSFTRTYAAAEVILQESRGLSADIYSLGCVFAEMIATILDVSKTNETNPTQTHWGALENARGKTETGQLRPYYSAVTSVQQWLSQLSIEEPELRAVRHWTKEMIQTDASARPSARQIADDPHLPFACLSCTLRTGPEDFECAEPCVATTTRNGND